MTQNPLISVDDLAHCIDRVVLIDCRADLFKPELGREQYDAGHLPGAHFMALHADLAGPKTPGSSRHPLPAREAFARRLGSFGIGLQTAVVAYDASSGVYAARFWWLARWLGHPLTQVLDGGLAAWTRAGFPLSREVPAPVAAEVSAANAAALTSATALESIVETARILSSLGSGDHLLVDARATERWRGDVEPLDPVAGHIPGALNRPNTSNLRPDGRFKPAEVLREEWLQLLGEARCAATVVHSCGSGVSACHNLLALRVAGLEGSSLHPGSWSEWCADPSRPVERTLG